MQSRAGCNYKPQRTHGGTGKPTGLLDGDLLIPPATAKHDLGTVYGFSGSLPCKRMPGEAPCPNTYCGPRYPQTYRCHDSYTAATNKLCNQYKVLPRQFLQASLGTIRTRSIDEEKNALLTVSPRPPGSTSPTSAVMEPLPLHEGLERPTAWDIALIGFSD